MRAVAALATVMALVVAAAAPVHAQDAGGGLSDGNGSPVSAPAGGDTINFGGSQQGSAGGAPAGGSGQAPAIVVSQQEQCTIGLQGIGIAGTPQQVAALFAPGALCNPTAGAPPPPTPAQVAQSWADSAVLPAPALSVPPGYAVTGLLAYLVTQTPAQFSVSVLDPFNQQMINVVCTPSEFDVDWGDGVNGTYAQAGTPYPDGTITHAYQWAAPATTISVVEHWACSWSIGGGGANGLGDLASPPARLTIEVREIQTTD